MAWVSGKQLQGGKYTIETELGEGGFGITYRARDNNGYYVVIKTLNDQVQRRPDFAKFQQDFINEAIKLAKCTHPHIVQIHEVINEDSLWCIVMEYIDGDNLASLVERQGVLSESEALRYIQQIGEALIVVHNNGLLHRDIKPHNIMLRAGKSEAVLIDFGIAREFSQNLTQSHTQNFSNGFAPIEQYDKRAKRGAYTDVYALAATLYSLLTGEIPTIAPIRAIGTSLEEPIKINTAISNQVNQAILKGMEVKSENRPQSVQDWLEILGLNYTNPMVQKLPLVTPSTLQSKSQQYLQRKAVFTVTDKTFKCEVVDSDIPVLVYFWAAWCGPCMLLTPVVDEIAQQDDLLLKVTKLNTDENQESCKKCNIRNVPSLVIFKYGKKVYQIDGAIPKSILINTLKKHI